jgi:FecR protein
MPSSIFGPLSAMALLVLACAPGAAAQGRQRCTVVTLTDPPRDVVRCPGVTLEAERATQYGLIDRNRDGNPEGARASGGAVLIEVGPSRPSGFQILTPHAIAAVRGTTYAVDVQPTQTSVF